MNPSPEEKAIRALGWTFVFRRAYYSGPPRAIVRNKTTKITAYVEHGETRQELAKMLLADILEDIENKETLNSSLTQPEIEKAEGLSEGIPE